MRTLDQLDRLKKIHRAIESRTTGPPAALAKKVNVSERYVYRALEQLKQMGAGIRYSRRQKSYCYTNGFKLKISVLVKTETADHCHTWAHI
jgi:predicted DNA-binding transcriptional regulator YafY